MNTIKTILFGLILFLIVACQTTAQKAYDALEKNEIDKALALANEANQENGQLPENQEVLKQARIKWINKKLIDVRMFRLSENLTQSESLLFQIIKNQSHWQVFPIGNVYATQAEELKLFDERLNIKLNESLKKKKPFLTFDMIKKAKEQYGFYLNKDYSSFLNSAKSLAEQQCLESSHALSKNDFYQIGFWRKSCLLFGVKPPFVKSSSPVKLFDHLQITEEESALGKTNSELIKSNIDQILNSTFKKSRWYDEAANQSLKLNIAGTLANDIVENVVRRYKDYTIKVPYEAEEIRTKQERGGVANLFFALSGEYEKDNGDGTVTVRVTKYREEQKTYHYYATEVRQQIYLNWQTKFSLENNNIEIEFKDNYLKTSDEHNENQSIMGLFPQKRIIIKTEDWLNLVLPELSNQFSQKLSQEWEGLFCQPLSGLENIKNEDLLKCAYGAEKFIPHSVDQFFQVTVGLDFNQWRSLITY